MYKLENWAIVENNGKPKFHGRVYGHTRFDDGEVVTTSSIVGYNPEMGYFITRSGSHYVLGIVNPVYESLYPNAKERVVAHALLTLETYMGGEV